MKNNIKLVLLSIVVLLSLLFGGEVSNKPITARALEEGMSKRFHLVDGNVILGTITRIDEDVCFIKTVDGVLRVPASEILEETAKIIKKDATIYDGEVLKETPETMGLRTRYGDVTVKKMDIQNMERFHGGVLARRTEETKLFHQGAEVLTDIFMDPTAFPLTPNVFYISGLSLGYGFTERFMIRTKFGSNFTGNLNVEPFLRFYHQQTGTNELAIGMGLHLFNRHPMKTVVANYSHQLDYLNSDGENLGTVAELYDELSDYYINNVENVEWGENWTDENLILQDFHQKFFTEYYFVMSNRRSLGTGRGKVGWHLGVKSNLLPMLSEDLLRENIIFSSGDDLEALGLDSTETYSIQWNENFKIPLRIWAGFEYDLSKRVKFVGEFWYDNGSKYRSLSEVAHDYMYDGTPFSLDAPGGEYRPIDFDFGFIYALNNNFRIGIHFQEPYLVFYWKFYEL
jgi:hypothetical protein